MTDQPTTKRPTFDDWVTEQAARTNWGPWPITDPDRFDLFSGEHAAALAWISTRGLDINRTPVGTSLDYGTDEQGRRTVTVEQFLLNERGVKVLLPDAEQTERRAFRCERVTVLDEPTDGAS